MHLQQWYTYIPSILGEPFCIVRTSGVSPSSPPLSKTVPSLLEGVLVTIFCAVCIALLSVHTVVKTEKYGIVSCLTVDENGTHFWNIIFS